MTPAWTVPLTDPAAADVALAGGKGAGLHRLVALGAQVPAGFVVSTAAFAAALDDAAQSEVEAPLRGLPPDPPLDALEQAAAEARAALVAAVRVGPVLDAVRTAYDALGVAEVAVRSSAAAEDAADSSYAGEHDTYLELVGADVVADAVCRCWASLYTARAVSYRGARPAGAMAVVVQEMVPARAAGVFMTLNPANGDRSTLVCEAVWGLGEPLVSGEVTPDRFTLDKVSGEILRREIATKPTRLVRAPGGGTVAEDVPADLRDASCLTDAGAGRAAARRQGRRAGGRRPAGRRVRRLRRGCPPAPVPAGDGLVPPDAPRHPRPDGPRRRPRHPHRNPLRRPRWRLTASPARSTSRPRPAPRAGSRCTTGTTCSAPNGASWTSSGSGSPTACTIPTCCTRTTRSSASAGGRRSARSTRGSSRCPPRSASTSGSSTDGCTSRRCRRPPRTSRRAPRSSASAPGTTTSAGTRSTRSGRPRSPRSSRRSGRCGSTRCPTSSRSRRSTSTSGHSAGFRMIRDFDTLVLTMYETYQYHFELLNIGYAAYLTFFGMCKSAFPDISDQSISRMVGGLDVELYRPDDELKRLAKEAQRLGLAEAIAGTGSAETLFAALRDDAGGRRVGGGLGAHRRPVVRRQHRPRPPRRLPRPPHLGGGPGHPAGVGARVPAPPRCRRGDRPAHRGGARRARPHHRGVPRPDGTRGPGGASTRPSRSPGWCSSTSRSTCSTSSTGCGRRSGRSRRSCRGRWRRWASSTSPRTCSSCAATRWPRRSTTASSGGRSDRGRGARTTGARSSAGGARSTTR